jgi:phospholipase/lecithinase/hemolysin
MMVQPSDAKSKGVVMRARPYVLALLGLSILHPAFAGPYSGVYFFGDSLTDVGNVTAVYANVPHPPGAPAIIPGPPYFQNRSSNGPIYADTLAAGLGFSATPSALGGNDFAFGGARTRYQLFGSPFLGISDQVAQFIAQPGPANPTALYVVWAGANNLQDILLGRTLDVNNNPIPGVAATLGDIAAMLNGLYAEGARDFLVPNAPNLGRVPRIAQLGAGAVAAGTGLSQAFDAGLSAVLDGFVLGHPDAQLTRFDTYGALESIVANAASLGLTDLTDRCYTGDDLTFTGGGTVCSDPNSFLFWDGIHPTSVVSQLIGSEMLAALGVPEPAEVLLFGVGLAALIALRRRRGTD